MGDELRFVHRIDRDDGIVHVNQAWLDFAVMNDAPHLKEANVLGRCLWEFIDDESTVHLYQIFVKRVRDTLESIEVPYRCDAPGLRRRMKMTISPLPGGEVEFSSVIESLDDREPVQILNAMLLHAGEYIRMCSWCKGVETEEGWQATEEAVKTLGLFRTPRLPKITHVMCEECDDVLRGGYGL